MCRASKKNRANWRDKNIWKISAKHSQRQLAWPNVNTPYECQMPERQVLTSKLLTMIWMYWKSVFGVAVQDILLIVKVHFTSKSKILAIYVTLQFMNFEALNSLWSVSFLEIVSKSKIYQLVKKIQFDAKTNTILLQSYTFSSFQGKFQTQFWRKFW